MLSILQLLQARGSVTAAEVADELEISTRTARRDLDALGQAGFPVYATRGRGGGWQLLGDGTTDLTGLTSDEVVSLFAALSTTRLADAEATAKFGQALHKLAVAVPAAFRDKAQIAATSYVVRDSWHDNPQPVGPLRSRTMPTDRLDAIHQQLHHAVINQSRVHLVYQSPGRPQTERMIDPLGLLIVRAVPYVVAETAAGRRTFRLDRVVELTPTEERFERPAGFSLQQLWPEIVASVRDQWQTVDVRFDVERTVLPIVRQLFRDVPFTAEPAADDRGWVSCQARCSSAREAAGYLAGLGNWATVREPAEVVELLGMIGRQLGDAYGHVTTGARHQV